ncbi:preprotein translocase subunit SecG [Rhodobacterales bacterium 52_120_T64]|nr:preprotein translocase subunit SecG [Rhodobacterales bacterium 52_120_T64]
MENIVLSIHLILTLSLIGSVLLQRSEGGGLGMGGGDSAGAGRSKANAMTKLTWMLAIGFLITSVTLTVIAAKNAGEGSVLDRLGLDNPTSTTTLTPDLGDAVLTPPSATDAPTAPPASE